MTTLLVQAAGLLTGALTARLLGPVGRGLLAGITNVSSSAAALGDCGGPTAYAYQTATDQSRIRQLVRNAVDLTLAQTLLVGCVGSVAMLFVMRHEGQWKYVGISFLILYVPLNLLTRYFAAIYQGQHDFKRFNSIRLSLTMSYIGAVALLFIFAVHALVPIVAATLASNVVALVVAARPLRAHHAPEARRQQMVEQMLRPRTPRRPRFDRELALETWRYGIRAHLGNLSPIDTLQVDVAVVLAFLGPREAGFYAVGSTVASVIRSLGLAIGLVALPTIAGAASPEEARRRTGVFFRAGVVVSGAAGGLIWIVTGIAVPLVYGASFAPAISVVRILVIGAIATSMRQVLNDSSRGAGRPLHGSIAEATSWVVLVIGLVILVPRFGITGAAVAVDVAYVLAFTVIMTMVVRSGPSLRELWLPTADDLALLRRYVGRLARSGS